MSTKMTRLIVAFPWVASAMSLAEIGWMWELIDRTGLGFRNPAALHKCVQMTEFFLVAAAVIPAAPYLFSVLVKRLRVGRPRQH